MASIGRIAIGVAGCASVVVFGVVARDYFGGARPEASYVALETGGDDDEVDDDEKVREVATRWLNGNGPMAEHIKVLRSWEILGILTSLDPPLEEPACSMTSIGRSIVRVRADYQNENGSEVTGIIRLQLLKQLVGGWYVLTAHDVDRD
jgi:hypothetical protein